MSEVQSDGDHVVTITVWRRDVNLVPGIFDCCLYVAYRGTQRGLDAEMGPNAERRPLAFGLTAKGTCRKALRTLKRKQQPALTFVTRLDR